MDNSFDDTIHTLYTPGIYTGYYFPFTYQCIIEYCGGKLQLEYPFEWQEKHKISEKNYAIKFDPVVSNFKKKELVSELCDLLNSDFNGRIQKLQMHIADYKATMDSGDISQERLLKTAEDLLTQFETDIGSLNQFLYYNAADLLRDELIVYFYNHYIKSIVENNTHYVITAEYLNGCVTEIMRFIDPLLTVTMQRRDFSDMQYAKDFFKEKTRKFLLTKIIPCIWPNELLLTSPLTDISDSLSFLTKSCEFLHDHETELHQFTSDEKLEICVYRFSVNSLEENYYTFRQKWSNIRLLYDDYMNDILLYTKSDKIVEPLTKEISMLNFSSLVFLALLEMIRNGDASQDTNNTRKNTYIVKCRNCERYFIPERANIIYCNQKAPNSDKTCAEIGARRQNRQNRTPATREREKIRNRYSSSISYANNARYSEREKALQDQLSQWDELERGHREELDAGNISEDEYIKRINDDFENLKGK